MSGQGANRNPPGRIPGNRRFRGIGHAFLLLIGVAVCVGAYYVYRGFASIEAEEFCKSNLMQLGLALEKYHKQHGSYPPAFVKGKDGKPAHSWRVQILPFLGRQDLYDAYRLDEPWNSPHNLLLANQMPDVFACPSGTDRAKGKTSYVAVVGSQTIWPGDRAPNLDELTRADGPSGTIRLIEIADSDIGWTEPRDVLMDEIIPPDGDDLGARFASGHAGIVHILWCDGHVKALKNSAKDSINRNVLYTVLTAWGGEPYKGEWLPGENQETSVGEFPTETDAKSLRTTDVLPHLADPIKADRNYIYCATFQLAWEDLSQFAGGAPEITGRPSIATALNSNSFSRKALSPTSYVARAGLGSEGIRDKILAEMAEKFPRVKPSFSSADGPNDLTIYAFLQKNLPFAVRFVPISEPLIFHGSSGEAKVKSFGFNDAASSSRNANKLKDQVDILYHQSDDEFVLRLKPDADEIILAKVRPAATLAETLQNVQKLIGTPPKKADRRRLTEKDKLIVPRLGFNVLRRYDELIGKHLENPGKKAWQIVEAKQAVRFLLNENGARLESEVSLDEGYVNGHKPPPPRNFVFDHPFLLYLKERTAEQPYFVMWIANAELMERR